MSINSNESQENVWIKNKDKQFSLELDEKLIHAFGDTAIKFGIMYPLSNENPETIISCRPKQGEFFNVKFKIRGGADTARSLVSNVIKYLDQKQNVTIDDVKNRLSSQTMEQRQEAEIRNPQDHTVQLAKKAGYVQGVCECVAVVGSEHNMGKKLLSEMQVTKDLAKKFANPETYKTLEKGIFAQKPEQKIEQTHSRKM